MAEQTKMQGTVFFTVKRDELPNASIKLDRRAINLDLRLHKVNDAATVVNTFPLGR